MASSSNSAVEARPVPSTSSQSELSASTDLAMNTSTPPRPSLSTSLSDFALSSSSSSPSVLDDSNQSKDDATPLLKKVRRPTISSWWLGLDQRVNSPLANTFTLPYPSSRKGKERSMDGDGEGEDMGGGFRDKDRMTTGSSSPSSESDYSMRQIRFDNPRMEEVSERPKSSPMDISRSASPASALKPPADILDAPGPSHSLPLPRRLSAPPKPARLLSLRAEARPDEIEVKHEAQVQRLLASFSGLPPGLGPTRSARTASNRGRFPEEAGEDEEFQREDTPSDDGEVKDDVSSTIFNYKVPVGSDPINIAKPSTPVPSVLGTPEGSQGCFRGISESPGMDIDVPMYAIGSPAIPPPVVPPQQWRQTPPPTSASSAVRTAKRKYEDRFDPYAPSAKRRAVSPSISHLKDRDLVSPIVIPRSPVLKPRKSFSQSQTNSTTSSPTVSNSASGYFNGNGNLYSLPLSGNGHHRSGSSSSVVSSPTVRASMILASPILRPVPRLAAGLRRAAEDEEKIVDGAGENLKELNIGRS
ncbi:uncharacterized protein FOMMEDRAFT_167014 [Fomitiporia mediterranea MF3/22]|uniref:uncharacterized protein n=1 Tax=Fomitiporia mediterranea (strain MF3/22) TaxID=694068 RepID=UPI00044077C5|nr:uncharacterized protein FOMMEDRAFT_167014 [Fomitiporia mediterranea MF3/22]EJD03672.1 hypothetical protein FOMMEDRAFT_167014 [Fomitiporia mediterranea MF3/22]